MAKSKLKQAAELMGAQGGNTKSEKRVLQAKINLEKARSKRWINWSKPSKCTVAKKHVYVDGICACGKMSKQEEERLHSLARAEIAKHEAHETLVNTGTNGG